MALTTQFSNTFLRPVMRPDLAVEVAVTLPSGGPVGVGGAYAPGTVLGYVTTAAAASEVRTQTVTGTPTGFTGTYTYTADKVYQSALANAASAVPTAAQVQTALEAIFGVGNVTVTKASLVYTITFGGVLANRRIGGSLTFAGTFTAGSSPASAFATTTQGTAGPGQADAYDDSKSDGTQVARGVLKYGYASDPTGGLVTPEWGVTGQPFSPLACVAGFYRCGDLTGLDANGVADFGRLVVGTDPTNAESVLFIR